MSRENNPKNQPSYKEMVRILRGVSSRFDPDDGYDLRQVEKWNAARKANITRKYREYTEFVVSFHQDMMPTRKLRSKKKKKLVRDFAGVDYPGFVDRAVFVPRDNYAQKKPPKVEVVEDNILVFRYGKKALRGSMWYKFDPVHLIQDTEEEAKDAIETLIKAGARSYAIRNGNSRMRAAPADSDILLNQLSQLMNEYSEDEFDPNDPNSKYYGNWLTGVEGFVPRVGMGVRARSDEGRAILERENTKERARNKRRQAKAKFEQLTGKKFKSTKD